MAIAALAPACAPGPAREIAEVERATLQQFALALDDVTGVEGAHALDRSLDDLAARICSTAYATPTEQLPLLLPGALARDRLLALLDLLAIDAFEAPEALTSKLAAVDYLVTQLCTDGDPHGLAAPSDPVMLSPALGELAQRAESECQGRLAELETDFFNAASLAADITRADELQALRARKANLGRGYFAPGMLRAVVTYNMALQQSDRPWICEVSSEGAESLAAPATLDSLFGSPGLQALYAAVKRRLAHEPVQAGGIERIARALPLDDLTPAEATALGSGTFAASDLTSAILFMGLLSRSLEILAIELQEIGIEPDRVSGAWTAELDQLVRLEVNGAIKGAAAGKTFGDAQKFSELRNRWLSAARRSVRREARAGQALPLTTQPVQSEREQREVRAAARELATEAVSGQTAPRERDARGATRRLPGRAVAAAGALFALAAVLALHLFGVIDLLGRDLDRWSGRELAEVSEYLVRGHRNAGGSGAAFVGTVGERWLSLTGEKRQIVAREIVLRLRERGVAQVMIYDEEHHLRIQGLGGAIQVL